MRCRYVEQGFCLLCEGMTSTCSQRSRTLCAAFGGALRASWISAVRVGLPDSRSLRRADRLRSNHGMVSLWSGCYQARDEGFAVGCDGPNGVHQLARGDNGSQFSKYSGSDRALAKGLEPRIASYGHQPGHPQSTSQLGMAGGCQAGALGFSLARLPEPGDDTDISGQRARTGEAGDIAEFGDQSSRSLRAEAINPGQPRADLLLVERALDVALAIGEASAPQVDVLGNVVRLEAVDRPTALAGQAPGCRGRRLGHFRPDGVPTIVAHLGQVTRRGLRDRLSRRVFAQDAGRQHLGGVPPIARELRKAQVDQSMELPRAVGGVLAQPIAIAHQLVQLLEGMAAEQGRYRLLHTAEADQPQGVYSIGFGADQISSLTMMGTRKIDQRHFLTTGALNCEQVPPVMSGRFRDHQHRRRSELEEQLGLTFRASPREQRLDQDRAVFADDGEGVCLAGDINGAVEHAQSFPDKILPEVSQPMLLLLLVQVKTADNASRQDTVRAQSTAGRRQSFSRRQRLKYGVATLCQLSSNSSYTGASK